MPAGKPIDLAYARQLVKNYADNKINHVLPPKETLAVWFSKENILSALGLPPDTNTGNITGIRTYLGAYGDLENQAPTPSEFGKITLVLVSTGPDSIVIERDGKSETAFLDLIIEPVAGSVTLPAYPKTEVVASKTIFNDGQSAPPPKDGIGLGLIVP